jgi:7,8-dihydro-6-hydroxymethylpterin dimethyltransferase
MDTTLSETESLCPVCFSRIPALRVLRGDSVYLVKQCNVHGMFEAPLWRGKPSFNEWHHAHACLPRQQVDKADNCPFDCGLCSSHLQQTCCALLEVTKRCDLLCPVCFASAHNNGQADPSLHELNCRLNAVAKKGRNINIQLSGGEPCVRDDLPQIVTLVRSLGFEFVQLNTNGLRIARDTAFLKKLKAAGLSTVFLQFDGTDDSIYRDIRGKNLFSLKQAAVEQCMEEQIGVVFVPTLIPGINTGNMGDIISFAIRHAPCVRGVHFQPVSYFGRYFSAPDDLQRITLPEVMNLLEQQTDGLLKTEHFKAPGGPHPLCSFRSTFVIMEDESLKPLTDNTASCCCQGDESEKTRAFVARQWSYPQHSCCAAQESGLSLGGWDSFLSRVQTHTFCVSAMAFQDAWTLDLERLRQCYLHIIDTGGSLVPFCAYNLTSQAGDPLYRRRKT